MCWWLHVSVFTDVYGWNVVDCLVTHWQVATSKCAGKCLSLVAATVCKHSIRYRYQNIEGIYLASVSSSSKVDRMSCLNWSLKSISVRTEVFGHIADCFITPYYRNITGCKKTEDLQDGRCKSSNFVQLCKTNMCVGSLSIISYIFRKKHGGATF